MVKKISFIILAVILALSVTACGRKSSPSSANSKYTFSSPLPSESPANETKTPESKAPESEKPAQDTMYLLTEIISYIDGAAYSRTYEYAKDGELFVERIYNADKMQINENKYDSNGNLVLEYNFDSNGDSGMPTEYTYDEKGVLKSEQRFTRDGVLVHNSLYNEYGNLSEYQQYYNTGKLSIYAEDIYDSKQYRILSTVYNDDGTVWTWHMFSHYDANGKQLSAAVDESLITEREPGLLTEYTYDSNENIIRKVEHSGSSAIRQTDSTYDVWGNAFIITVSDFSGGSLRSSDLWEIDFEYDASGNILSQTKYYNGAQFEKIVSTYDSRGNILSEEKDYDDNKTTSTRKIEYIYKNIAVG